MRSLKDRVFEAELKQNVYWALRNAQENGYFENVSEEDFQLIAEDLVAHDSELENESPLTILPFVREFFGANDV